MVESSVSDDLRVADAVGASATKVTACVTDEPGRRVVEF